jgi:hypothetical protein
MKANCLESVNTSTHAMDNEFPELHWQKCEGCEQSEQSVETDGQILVVHTSLIHLRCLGRVRLSSCRVRLPSDVLQRRTALSKPARGIVFQEKTRKIHTSTHRNDILMRSRVGFHNKRIAVRTHFLFFFDCCLSTVLAAQ